MTKQKKALGDFQLDVVDAALAELTWLVELGQGLTEALRSEPREKQDELRLVLKLVLKMKQTCLDNIDEALGIQTLH